MPLDRTNRPLLERFEMEDTGLNETAADVPDEPEMPPAGHPLHKLGERLAHYLDDDKFNECEALLLEGWDHDRIDRKTGQHWREDSSLEVWFPLTAEWIERLVIERDALRARIDGAITGVVDDHPDYLVIAPHAQCAAEAFALIGTGKRVALVVVK